MTTAPSLIAPLDPKEAPEPVRAPVRRQTFLSRWLFPIIAVALLAWGAYIVSGDPVPVETFDPTLEFSLDDPVIGGDWQLFGLSWAEGTINKGVVYLFLALIGCCLVALYVNRRVVHRDRLTTKPQTIVEGLYEFAHDQIAAALGQKVFSRYMPYIAAVFIFILFLNLLSFLPLPLNTHHTIGGTSWLYSLGLYAVTSNIYCTATLAFMTFGIYHYEGVRAHGFGGYLKTWTAGQKGAVVPLIFFIEAMSNLVLKPLSLALRLFANMLAGHVLILLMLALAGVLAGGLGTTLVAQIGGGALALAFYLFEMVLIAGLQAFIFAVLSAIYIGGAVEEHH